MQETHFESLYPEDSRFDEIEQIFTYIKAGDSCQVVGLPGVGRANMLELLIYNHSVREAHVGDSQKLLHFVGVDFSEVRNKPLFEVTKLMFLELVESLHERQKEEEYTKVSQMFKDALIFQDELVLFQGFKKAIDFLATEKGVTIIFLFERFEEYLPMLSAGFFSNLRVLRSKAKYRFSVVFSLGRPLEEVVDPFMLADFYEFFAGNTVFLSLSNKPITDFRIAHLEKITGKKLDASLLQKVLELTGGHGKLTRHCLEIVIQKENVPDVDTLLKHKHVEGTLLEIWYYLTPEEQEELKEIAKQSPLSVIPDLPRPVVAFGEVGIGDPKIDSRLRGNDKKRDSSALPQNDNLFLEQLGLIKSGKITIPLLEIFIQENLSKQPEQKIVFDEATNSIKRGNDLLSDILTASEFRLLRLLVTNEGKVMERQEIINAVWGNLASTQGVTEQAIDQLVFRLRKKIEENPNQPTHIITIKGRGIKYHS